jgi:hypothetical protein
MPGRAAGEAAVTAPDPPLERVRPRGVSSVSRRGLCVGSALPLINTGILFFRYLSRSGSALSGTPKG